MSLQEHAKSLVQPAIVGAVTYLFVSITDLKHNQDIKGVKVDQNSSELLNLWQMKNEDIKEDKVDRTKNFEFALELIEGQHELELQNKDLELQIKDLEIKFLENKIK